MRLYNNLERKPVKKTIFQTYNTSQARNVSNTYTEVRIITSTMKTTEEH
jgi:hypothetical protein